MPIETKHPEYAPQSATVTLDAYHGNVLDYVPKLTKQSSSQYDAYRQRGVYFNVTKKTTEAMIGAALRKPFITDMEDAYVDDWISLHELVSQTLRGVILQGRMGLLCDWDELANSPKVVLYDRVNIINWRDNGSLIVLQETLYEEDPKDRYNLVPVTQYRELFIDPETGNYTVRLWKESGSKTPTIIDEVVPTRRGEPLKYIPFTFVTPFDTSYCSHAPVMHNMAQLNISHFKTTVDIEHGCHFTALPQPYLAGEFSEDMSGEVPIGSEVVWQLTEGSRVGYLEFTGAGLKTLEERLNKKEEQMATLGTQLLSPRNGVESADALRIRSGAETATLTNVVISVESAMKQILTYYKNWLGVDEEAEFEMNRDFSGRTLSPQEMLALMQLFMNGTISQETYLENLFDGEITPEVAEEMIRLSGSRSEVNNERAE